MIFPEANKNSSWVLQLMEKPYLLINQILIFLKEGMVALRHFFLKPEVCDLLILHTQNFHYQILNV